MSSGHHSVSHTSHIECAHTHGTNTQKCKKIKILSLTKNHSFIQTTYLALHLLIIIYTLIFYKISHLKLFFFHIFDGNIFKFDTYEYNYIILNLTDNYSEPHKLFIYFDYN